MIQAVITDGRQVGIHTVITADRRNAIPSRLHASISNRLMLRQADETSHSEHGIPTVRPLSTPTRSCNRPERAYRCAQASTWCQAATCSSPTVNPPSSRSPAPTEPRRTTLRASGGTICGMSAKTTVYLPDELKKALEREARRRGCSEAHVIREALTAAVERTAPRPGILDTEPIADRVDDLLAGFGER